MSDLIAVRCEVLQTSLDNESEARLGEALEASGPAGAGAAG